VRILTTTLTEWDAFGTIKKDFEIDEVPTMTYRRLPFEQYFINTSEDFNHTGNATYTVEYTAVSYSCNPLEKLLGMNHEVNYEIHYEPDRDVIQIHFQKTNGRADWFANVAEFSSKYYDAIEFEGQPLQLRVHHGWAEMYKTIKRLIREEWKTLHDAHPEAETEVIGWSLGSGQATLCCQDLNYNFGAKPILITFGSVKPFKSLRSNREQMERYLATVCKECWNFANINDIITYMPPFRGFGTIRRVNVTEKKRITVARLLNPYYYHTIYDRKKLYQNIE